MTGNGWRDRGVVVVAGALVVLVLSAVLLARSCDDEAVTRKFTHPLPAEVIAPTGSPNVREARRIAESLWPKRCEGSIGLYHRKLTPRLTLAQAEWYEESQGGKVLRRFHCSITLNSDREPLPFWQLCGALAHEYGHLSGWLSRGGSLHSANSNSVMFPKLTHRNTPRACHEAL